MQVHWRNPNELTPEERAGAEERLEGLAADHTDLIDVWIDVSKTPHHRQGNEEITIRCQARGKDLVAHGRNVEPRLALRDALQTFEREVKRLRSRRRDRRTEQPAAPPLRGVIDVLNAEADHGFLITDAGDRVYFHRNAVGDGLAFDDLSEGQSVSLNVEPGEKGPQATIVAPAPPDGR